MTFKFTTRVYANHADGVRYNVSFSHPQKPKEVHYYKFRQWIECVRAGHSDCRQMYIPTMGTGKLGRRVHPKESRAESNIYRSIREIRAIGLSNDWDYFVTFTLDPKKHDRSDYASVAKKMTQYFRDLRKQGNEIEYLLIPELHKDYVNYHFHGLIRGLPDHMLSPHPLKWQREQGYKDFPAFASRFGFVTLSPVKSTNAVVYYCMKYINKDLGKGKLNDGMRTYYVSRGLKRPILMDEINNVEFPFSILHDSIPTTEYFTAYARGLSQEEKDSILNWVLQKSYVEPEGVNNAQVSQGYWEGGTYHRKKDPCDYTLFE